MRVVCLSFFWPWPWPGPVVAVVDVCPFAAVVAVLGTALPLPFAAAAAVGTTDCARACVLKFGFALLSPVALSLAHDSLENESFPSEESER